MTAKVSELADSLMRDASGLQRRADALLETIETMMPARLMTGMAAQAAIDDLAAAAALARTRHAHSTPPPCACNCSAQ